MNLLDRLLNSQLLRRQTILEYRFSSARKLWITGGLTEVVEGLKKTGIGSEFSATIKARGVTACYFATQSQLGGFQLEVVGR